MNETIRFYTLKLANIDTTSSRAHGFIKTSFLQRPESVPFYTLAVCVRYLSYFSCSAWNIIGINSWLKVP